MDLLLNDVQLGMLYHTKKKSSIYGIYNSQVVIEWKEQVDVIKLQETWDYLNQTYEVLRSYLKNDSTMTFVDNQSVKIKIMHQQDASEKGINKTLKQLFSQPIDLYTAPLFNLTLLQINDYLSYLVWTHHHILLSASSVTEIMSSMFQYYDGDHSNQEKKIISCGHYSSKFSEEDKLYWENLLSGFTESNQLKVAYVPEQQGRPQHNNHMVNTRLHVEPFIEQAKHLGVTLNTLFLAAWAIILNRYTMDDDIVFGTVRQRQAENHDVGMDINTLPIRVIFTEKLSVFELCSNIRKQQIELGKHANLSLREISKHCFHKKNITDEL